jgi:hypothetical protein
MATSDVNKQKKTIVHKRLHIDCTLPLPDTTRDGRFARRTPGFAGSKWSKFVSESVLTSCGVCGPRFFWRFLTGFGRVFLRKTLISKV